MPRITLVIDDPELPLDVAALVTSTTVVKPTWDLFIVQPRPGAGPTVVVKMRDADGEPVLSTTSARLWCQVAAELKRRFPILALEEQATVRRPNETIIDRQGRL